MRLLPRVSVRVVLNRPELDLGEEPGYLSEWGHAETYWSDETGCWFDWGGDARSYFPWSSVLRVEHERCRCFTCTREGQEAA